MPRDLAYSIPGKARLNARNGKLAGSTYEVGS